MSRKIAIIGQQEFGSEVTFTSLKLAPTEILLAI